MKIIVIGAGKVGYNLAHMLSEEGHDVTVCDINEDRIALVEERLDVKTVLGNGASPDVLREAGVEEADILAAVTERDELNMVACYIAKQLEVGLTIARIRSPEFVDIDKTTRGETLGIDLIINPERIAALQIAKMIKYPEALNVEYYDNGRVQMLELKINSEANVVGLSLKDITCIHPFLVVCISRDGQMIIPGGDDVIMAGDLIFVVAETIYMEDVEQMFGHRHKTVKNIIIAGGGRISYYLATVIGRESHIKIIEQNVQKCKELANILDNALVIQGSPTDIQLLKDEHIADVDLYVAITEDDEQNVLSAILAKQLGAKKTITQIRMSDYIPLVEKIGIDQIISPRLLAAGAILKYVRRSNIVSITLIGDANAHILEIIVPENAIHTNIPLLEVNYPKGAIIGTIIRNNQVIIPRGMDKVVPGDKIIIFALPTSSKEAEKFFEA